MNIIDKIKAIDLEPLKGAAQGMIGTPQGMVLAGVIPLLEAARDALTNDELTAGIAQLIARATIDAVEWFRDDNDTRTFEQASYALFDHAAEELNEFRRLAVSGSGADHRAIGVGEVDPGEEALPERS